MLASDGRASSRRHAHPTHAKEVEAHTHKSIPEDAHSLIDVGKLYCINVLSHARINLVPSQSREGGMEIIGWIREGDRAACGGLVVEGDQSCISHGRPYSFQGAHLACKKKCSIAEGFVRCTLTNGRSAVIHGMKTSGGCPLLSTLNDIDGVSNEAGTTVPLSFVQDNSDDWVGDTFEEQTGKRFLFADSETGEPLANRKFVARVGDRKQEGTTDKNGYADIDAEDGEVIELHLVFEAPTGPLTFGGV
jgi:uncharacterized Zn-binding protein involved in type VI secretion